MVKMPLEALHHIFQYLEPPDIIVLRMVCLSLIYIAERKCVDLLAGYRHVELWLLSLPNEQFGLKPFVVSVTPMAYSDRPIP
jgi:hypothetical protein